jgi:flagellar FliJ protein
MAFRFPLASVLRVREILEQREERALQQIQMEMARISHQIEEQTAVIAGVYDAQAEALRQPISAGVLHSFQWEEQKAIERRKVLLAALQTLEQKREKQIKIYQVAHRNHEALISMKKAQRNAYELEQARAQQKSLDDLFIARRQRI